MSRDALCCAKYLVGMWSDQFDEGVPIASPSCGQELVFFTFFLSHQFSARFAIVASSGDGNELKQCNPGTIAIISESGKLAQSRSDQIANGLRDVGPGKHAQNQKSHHVYVESD